MNGLVWPILFGPNLRQVCRRDRSIAQGLEEFYEPASPSPSGRRRRQQGCWLWKDEYS